MLHQIVTVLAPLLRRSAPDRVAVAAAYAAVVAQARRPDFYLYGEVPDTVDGRFDLIVLHLCLLYHRLHRDGSTSDQWLTRLLEHFITDMDRSLREMGVGDLSVGRHIKVMAHGLSGRVRVYDRALAALPDRSGLRVCLDNNLYGTVLAPRDWSLAAMTAYCAEAAAGLAAQPTERLRAGEVRFPPPPQPTGSTLDQGGSP